MRIGIRAHDVKADTFEGLVEAIHEQGMHCCQLAVPKAIKEFPTQKEVLTPGLALYMKEIFAANKVDVAVLGCYHNLATPDEEALADTTDTYKRHILFASLLGAGVVGTETGNCNVEYRYEPYSHTEEALQIFIKNLRPVVEYAEKLGVIVGIEPVCRHIVCNAKRARAVLDAIKSPNLQIIFDPVNLLNEKNCAQHVEIIKEFTELLGPDIATIHAKDFKLVDGVLKSCPCGFGEMNYDFLMSYIKNHKPHIHVLLEDTVPENALQAKAFLEEAYSRA
ncbi:MAG: sugar phosphate isomerase/epimerase [Lachnospiraceae bacterium]|nr:sugar phosphate isomerase/epimerase [Lachnospiraceae bacterium]